VLTPSLMILEKDTQRSMVRKDVDNVMQNNQARQTESQRTDKTGNGPRYSH